jgi:hypothetical protein
MTDKKISQLTGATTPVAGTEVLPIVQSGTTVKVSIDNLTAGKNVSASSVNKVAITAPATSATLTIADGKTLTANNSITLAGTDATTMTFPSTSATIARTDAAQTFTGNQTVSGLLISKTATGGDLVLDSTTGGTENRISSFVDSGNLLGLLNYIGTDHVFKYGTQENFRIDLNGDAIIKQANRALVFGGNGNVFWRTGASTPEGAVVAPVGSLYTRTDGGANTTLYVKESGAGNTGWVAK